MERKFNLKVFSKTSKVGNKYLKFVLSDNENHSCVIAPMFANDIGLLLSMADNVGLEEDKDNLKDIDKVGI